LTKEFQVYYSLEKRYIAGMTLMDVDSRNRILSDNFLSELNDIEIPEKAYLEKFQMIEHVKSSEKLALVDMYEYLPEDLLVKADIASMRYSLEVRSPLLDLDLVEFALTIPTSIRMHRGVSKSLLKGILGKYVPRNLFDRQKMGFAIPRASWLRNELHELSHDLLLDSVARSRGWTNLHEVEKLLRIHDGGTDKDSQIWPLICLELWARNWLDAK
jgi:asparagine synthase (glutamine-hydrolysing)